jgi:hypothetical protein
MADDFAFHFGNSGKYQCVHGSQRVHQCGLVWPTERRRLYRVDSFKIAWQLATTNW